MLYWLTQLIQGHFHAFRVFQYLTFRSILAALTALLIGLCCGPWLIRWLKGMQMGQVVRDDGPASHLSKAGTPTMGGIIILISMMASCLLWGRLTEPALWVALLVTLGFGVIGWVDDYRKVVQKNAKGLSGTWKYSWQSVVAVIAIAYLMQSATLPLAHKLAIPFLKHTLLDLGVLFPLLAYFVLVGSSNAVNLTDG
ncbi:MAG TPA: phospho-N-acetylmuramoyl-pentapeptide-transferase, partial [Legionellales bacterium]|nr:phospho-N-acetylmuramoyl-pentapeptide-transferase [Legionellales bacterium]